MSIAYREPEQRPTSGTPERPRSGLEHLDRDALIRLRSSYIRILGFDNPEMHIDAATYLAGTVREIDTLLSARQEAR